MSDENFYSLPSPEELYAQELKTTVEKHPTGSLIYLEKTKQIGVVDEVKATADGIAIKIRNIGLVPITETRALIEEDLKGTVFAGNTQKRNGLFFLESK